MSGVNCLGCLLGAGRGGKWAGLRREGGGGGPCCEVQGARVGKGGGAGRGGGGRIGVGWGGRCKGGGGGRGGCGMGIGGGWEWGGGFCSCGGPVRVEGGGFFLLIYVVYWSELYVGWEGVGGGKGGGQG